MNDILQHKEYYAQVHFSTEDNVLYGKLTGINDLILFEGDSVKELNDALVDAVEDYLETCVELNKEPQKPSKGDFNIRISQELYHQPATVATIKKVTQNNFMNQSVDASMAKNGLSSSL